MDKGIWRVARARLCVACLQEMAAEYIIEPAFHGWAQGVCQRCGKERKMTTIKRYTMSKRGLEKRGLLNEQWGSDAAGACGTEAGHGEDAQAQQVQGAEDAARQADL